MWEQPGAGCSHIEVLGGEVLGGDGLWAFDFEIQPWAGGDLYLYGAAHAAADDVVTGTAKTLLGQPLAEAVGERGEQ